MNLQKLCKEKNIDLFIFISPSYLATSGSSNYNIIGNHNIFCKNNLD